MRNDFASLSIRMENYKKPPSVAMRYENLTKSSDSRDYSKNWVHARSRFHRLLAYVVAEVRDNKKACRSHDRLSSRDKKVGATGFEPATF